MTNITEEHRDAFGALCEGRYDNFALFSCFCNGMPTSAIVSVNQDEEGSVRITPLFVAVTPDMQLADHDGMSCQSS